jgi:hypothetical protein
MAPQSARADVGAASLWVVFGVSRETSALAFPCAILDRLMLILCPCSVAPSLPNTVPALLLVVQYYAGAISGLERLYLKPAPGTGRTDARLVVEPASPLHPATGRAASQLNWAPAVLASLRLGRDWLFAGKMPCSWARCLFQSRLGGRSAASDPLHGGFLPYLGPYTQCLRVPGLSRNHAHA